MRKSRKELESEISELKSKVESYERKEYKSSVIEKYHLPKCESFLCQGCEYAVFSFEAFRPPVLLGCSKDIKCEDFVSIRSRQVLCPNSLQRK